MASATKRFVNFLKVFTRSKRGLIGIGILVLFVGVAAAAPLLTPYDPNTDVYLAGVYSTPLWFKYLPSGGNLTENIQTIEEPGFDWPTSLLEWDFNMTTSPASNVEEFVTIDWTKSVGNTKNGSIVISYTPQAGQSFDQIEVTVSKKFYYPFAGPPNRFLGTLAYLVKGVDKVPVRATFFIARGETRYDLWTITSTEPYGLNNKSWTIANTLLQNSLDSGWQAGPIWAKFNATDPTRQVFSQSGDYVFGIDAILFPSSGAKEEASIYIDDLDLKLFGTSFGYLGTDFKGRDIFTQLVYGTRISLFVGLLSAGMSVIIGLVLGLIAGYLGAFVDEFLMRFTDMLLVLPTLPLLLVLIAVLGPSIWNVIFLIGLLGWMGFARVVRAQVLSLKERPFIEAARAVGAGKFYIIWKHIVPNVVSLIYVTLALSVPGAILSEAALSWLGLFDPSVMSWGRMLHDAEAEAGGTRIWWWVIPPGLAIAVISLSFVLLGYALDETLNPKLRQRR